MTPKKIYNIKEEAKEDFKKLSIQVSLNGLSFCVLDTIENSVLLSENVIFKKQLTPIEIKNELSSLLTNNNILNSKFTEVIVIHRNSFFSLVPKPLFDTKELKNYLKYNTKILANDHIAYDEINSFDVMNVYVPFVNINNYIYDLYGEFEFQHSGTIMVHSLLNSNHNNKDTICFVHLNGKEMDITVIAQKKLVLYNSYTFYTKEDFIYYLLFTFEQLQLDTEGVALKLFGSIEEDDEKYKICYKYVKQVSIFIPDSKQHPMLHIDKESIDFTLLSSF